MAGSPPEQSPLLERPNQANRAPVSDVEVGVIMLEQGVNVPVEISEGVGVLPADARHVGATGTTPGIPQAFVRDRSIDGRELVILVITHGKRFLGGGS